MRPRNTLLLLLVLAALGAYVYWVEIPHEKTEAEQKRLLVFDKEKVGSITLQNGDTTIALERGDDKHWRITKPIEADADDATVNNLLTALSDAQITRTLEGVGDKAASYGLDPPQAVVTLGLTDGTTLPPVKVGKGTQVGFAAYVRKGDEDAVHITGGALPVGVKKEVKDLRDKTVLAFDDGEVKKVVLAKPGTAPITIERDGADAWKITSPGQYPADAAEVRAFLASLRGIRADDFATDDPNAPPATYGLDQPRLTITVFVGKDEAQKTLLVGGTKEDPQKKTIYAKRAERPTVYTIPEYTVKNIDKDVNTLRDKTVLAFDKAKAGKLVVTRKDGAGFTLVKRDGAWHIETPGEGAERAPSMTRFVEDVATLKGGEVLDEHATDLAHYQLADPDITIAVSDESGNALGTILASRGVPPTNTDPDAKSYATAAGSGIVSGMKPFVFDRINKKASDFRQVPATPAPSGAVAATPAAGIPGFGADQDADDTGGADAGDDDEGDE